MFLSRIILDCSKPNVCLAIRNVNKIHGMIAKDTRNNQQRILWRIDILRNEYHLYLLSREKVNWSRLNGILGKPNSSYEQRNYSTLLDRIQNDSFWHFKVTCVPTVSVNSGLDGTGIRGKKLTILNEDEQRQWLKKQGEKNGFEVNPDQVLVSNIKRLRFRKKDENTVAFTSITMEGTLKVTNDKAFIECLCNGLGPRKAYGQGLLTVVGTV